MLAVRDVVLMRITYRLHFDRGKRRNAESAELGTKRYAMNVEIGSEAIEHAGTRADHPRPYGRTTRNPKAAPHGSSSLSRMYIAHTAYMRARASHAADTMYGRVVWPDFP